MQEREQATSNGAGQYRIAEPGNLLFTIPASQGRFVITYLDEYQTQASKTAVYPGKFTLEGLAYCALGLGEAGEVQGKVKKIIRDDGGVLTEEKRQEIVAELGDVLWYVANLCEEISIPMSEVATRNIAKLRSRQERGVLGGSGDNR